MCFGFRQYAGRSIPAEREQDVILRIIFLKKSGYSYQKIADLLNDDRVKKNLELENGIQRSSDKFG
jgi:hypothetical protein